MIRTSFRVIHNPDQPVRTFEFVLIDDADKRTYKVTYRINELEVQSFAHPLAYQRAVIIGLQDKAQTLPAPLQATIRDLIAKAVTEKLG